MSKPAITAFQRELLAGIARDERPRQNRNAARSYNIMFRAGYLTDIDPADGRHAIGGMYLTPKGREVLQASELPGATGKVAERG